MKKPPNALSLDELQKLLDESSKEEISEVLAEDYKNDVLGFISAFNLTTGSNPVLKKNLYNIYRSWTKEPVSQPTFTLTLQNVLESNVKHYLLNQEALNLNASAYKLLLNKKKDKVKSTIARDHFDKFITDNKIKPGKVWVRLKVLRHIYKQWRFNSRIKGKLGDGVLRAFFRANFETKVTRTSDRQSDRLYWVGVDKEIYTLHSLEQMLSYMKAVDEKGPRRNQPHKSKKANSVSPPERKERRKEDKESEG